MSEKKHNFLVDEYIAQHDSAAQAKFRKLRPWPVGCVFIQHPDMDYEDCRVQFKLMKELGYTALKQCQTCRGTDNKKVMHIALEEGIIPWWYGEAGYEDPTPELLESLGIDPNISAEDLRENNVWLDRQMQIMRDRIDGKEVPPLKKAREGTPEVPGVQLTFDYALNEEHVGPFQDWLKEQYGTIEALNEAWNVHHCMIPGPQGQSIDLPKEKVGWASWEELAKVIPDVVNNERREYRRIRDVLRFKADIYLQRVKYNAHVKWEADKNAPFRAGGEMGLFLPFASRGTDMEGIAEVCKDYGSFYPSFHLAWHFEETDFETVRPFYMQSSITTDWFKGGWAATWESTGGPQQMTGHKAPFVPAVRDKTPGFTVDEGIMTQLMYSWIAGGYRGFGLWAWSVRTCGWEGGEFGLIDRNYRPTDRAIKVGKIGQTCRKYRDELWDARKEPEVGIFQDWDMEAIWAASSLGGRDHFKSEPIRARIGAARAMINGNIPFEHVTGSDILNGLAPRYKTIILPASLAISQELVEKLTEYVEQGGKVILDAPGAWFDYYGRLHSTDDGTPFEKLFGCRIADYQYSREGNRTWKINGNDVYGCTFDLQPTTAKVVEEFDHSTKKSLRPAITENKLGKGSAIILGFEATRPCWRPGSEVEEALLRDLAMGKNKAPYSCKKAIVYKLGSPTADHYFLMNDEEAKTVKLKTKAKYKKFIDPLTDKKVDPDEIKIDAHSGRWIRAIK